MSAHPPDNSPSSPQPHGQLFAEIREYLARAWQAGEAPRIEDHLGGLTGPDRLRLLRELLASEVKHRLRRGEVVVPADYQGRFPELPSADLDSLLAALLADYPPLPSLFTVPWPPPGSPQPWQAGAGPAGPRYRALRLHARGGLGEVHLAEDAELGRAVALKCIQSRHLGNGEARRRFLREAQVTSRLEHPGVVPVYGLIEQGDEPCYAMRFIEGQSLKEAIDAFHAADHDPGERRLALRELLGRFTAVCNTVAYAHSKGVIHRDLKPANVMLGPYGETLVVDWGLARIAGLPDEGVPEGPVPDAESGETREGAVLGTPAYMSPEQAAGRQEDVGPASDVYSLGATLYHLLTGLAPIQGGDRDERIGRARSGQFVPARQVKRNVPRALDAVCRKAMALRADDRYASAADLARDVDRWLADEPVSAYRAPLVARLRRWARRHRTLVASGAAAVLAALLLGGGAWWWWARVRAEGREQTTRKVNGLLTQASHSRGEARGAAGRARLELLREARAKVEGAREALHAGVADADLRRRVEELRTGVAGEERQATAALAEVEKGAATVRRLEEAMLLPVDVRFEKSLHDKRPSAASDVLEFFDFDPAAADRAFREAFANHGIDVDGLSVAEAARRIRPQAIRAELVTGLDAWAFLPIDARKRQRLVAVAQAVDEDGWRKQLRALVRRGDAVGLVRLAASPDVEVQPPISVIVLARQLFRAGEVKAGVKALRRAHRRHPRDLWLNHQMGVLLLVAAGRVNEIDVRSYSLAHAEAARFFQAALALRGHSASLYAQLGQALAEAGDIEAALRAFRKVVQLNPDSHVAAHNLAVMRRKAGDLGGAVDAFRQVLRRKGDYAEAHYSLGGALVAQGRLREGIQAYRQAVKHKPEFAEAHCNLGLALQQTGPLAEALEALRRGHRLGTARPGWAYTSAAWVAHCECLLALEKRLPALLDGSDSAADPAETLLVAEVCLAQGRYADAYRFFKAGLQEAPPTLSTVLMGDRYRAACAAVRAAAGEGKGAARSEPVRAEFRGQALQWLRADLREWPGLLAQTPPLIYGKVMEPLKRWRTSPDLATVRDAGALDRLPGPEARLWRRFWAEVEALLERAAPKLAPAE